MCCESLSHSFCRERKIDTHTHTHTHTHTEGGREGGKERKREREREREHAQIYINTHLTSWKWTWCNTDTDLILRPQSKVVHSSNGSNNKQLHSNLGWFYTPFGFGFWFSFSFLSLFLKICLFILCMWVHCPVTFFRHH